MQIVPITDPDTLPPETLPLLIQLLRQILGSKVKIVRCCIANHHDDYFVLLIDLRQPSISIVVKLAGQRAPYPCLFDRTAALHQLVSAHISTPIPEILAVDVSYREWPWRYLIELYIPGEEWVSVRQRLNPQELYDSYQQIGTAVAELHTIKFPEFGELSAEATTPSGTHNYLAALITRARQSIRSPRLTDLFLALLEANAGLFTHVQDACLCHEDLHGHNLLFKQAEGRWRLAAILDFDKAWAGHYEIDLARLELWGMTKVGFYSGYNAVSYDELFERRRSIYQLLWCLEYAVPTPQHLADTQRLCKALGFPVIQKFE